MKRAVPLVLAVAVLSSCVAITVEKRKPRKGPVKEVGYIDYGGGQVRYSAEGWGWAVASRRKTALRLMARNCGSELKPEITDEYSRSDADAAYNGEDIDSSMRVGDEHFKIERYIHLSYECRPKGAAPTVAVSTPTASGPTLVIPAVSASSSAAIVALSTAAVPVDISTASAPVMLSTAPATISPNTLPAPEPAK
ncbi:MAG TPA: hypothetical protein VN915_08275 [Elusimicrobiota bacterium]|nr:hypothetical protein [Elusimicrobiota bacterium]